MDVPVRDVVCERCGAQVRHPLFVLEQFPQYQGASRDGTRLNYACPECKTLTSSPLGEVKILSDIDFSRLTAGATIYFVSLRCAKANCDSRVVLLAPVKSEVRGQVAPPPSCGRWRNQSAVCGNNHPPAQPLEVTALILPAGRYASAV